MHASPPIPYKGLAPYAEEDAPFFFGRGRDRDIIAANLLTSRLTVLYGSSGVGKSSVLRAGVAAHLREVARAGDEPGAQPEYVVVVFDSWRDDPLRDLASAIREAILDQAVASVQLPDATLGLGRFLQEWASAGGVELLVVLDQFEEHFLYRGADDGPGTFAVEFPEVVNRRDLRVNFLLSVREDSLAKLDAFKGRIPNLFDNYLRIEHLDEEAARAAIVNPLQKFNSMCGRDAAAMAIEGPLVDAVIDQVEAGQVIIGDHDGGVADRSGRRAVTERRIETPYLQLVMRRLWSEEVAAGSRTLRLKTLGALGGAGRIVRTHLDDAMATLSPPDQATAAAVLRFLVTPSGTKIAHTSSDLADYAEEPEARVSRVLQRLAAADARILRPVPPPSGQPAPERYEIYHDVLAAAILDWRGRYTKNRTAAEAERLVEEEVALEALHGKAWRLSRDLAIGSVFVAVPVAIDVATTSTTVFPQWLVGLAAWFGWFALVLSGHTLIKIWKGIGKATQVGFGWSTMVQVLAHHWAQPSAGIGGSRRYARWGLSLPPAVQVARLRQIGLLLLAAAVPAPTLLLMLALASRGFVDASSTIPGVVLGLPMLLLTGAVAAAYSERQAVRRTRSTIIRQHDQPDAHATRGSGPMGGVGAGGLGDRPLRRREVGVCLLALWGILVAAGLVLAQFATVPWLGGVLWQILMPRYDRIEAKARLVESGRVYRLPPDTRISAIEAGRALYSLDGMRFSRPPSAPERPLPRQLPGIWIPWNEDPYGYFPTAFDTIMGHALRGFSAKESLFLSRVATHPAFVELHVVARAPRIDYHGARFMPGFSKHYDFPLAIPIHGFPVKEGAYASVGKAALEVSRGHPREAEATLREVVTLGFQMRDNATTLLDDLMGSVIIGIGLQGLANLYAATGRQADANRIRAARDWATRVNDEISLAQQRGIGESRLDVEAIRQAVLRAVGDSANLRGARWEMLWVLATAPCTNLHELVFGPSGDIQRAVAAARRQLPRFDSERELFNLYNSLPTKLPDDAGLGLIEHAASQLGRVSGGLVGNKRLSGCVNAEMLLDVVNTVQVR